MNTLYNKKQGGKMNILEFLKNGDKIKKAQWGIDLDVDNRSDTTRQGSGTMPDRAYGAANASNTGGLLSLLDIFNTVKDTGPSTVTLPNGKQVTFPGVQTGTPIFLPTFGPGLLQQGRLVNYVMNPAEKAARADFLKSANEIKTLAGSGHIPKGVQDDWMYPTEILKKYKLKQFSTPVKQEVSNQQKITKLSETSSAKKTSSQRSKEYYSKKVEDKNNGVSKVRSRQIQNNKAQTTGDMRAANTGRPRRAARYNDLRTELEKDTGFWGKQYNKIRKKVAQGKQGAESKEKEFLESYWNYKQKGILNKEKSGGILNLFKKGGGIHIKEKNKGKFTSYCGGKVTDECIRKAKASGNPTLVKRATFAQNARHFKHKEGGTVKAQEGTKFNWGSAIGNLASTALQQGISTYMQNKKLSSDGEVDKERYKSEAASKLQKDMQDERTKRFNILNAIKGTSDNPNAFGGGIFENYFINQGDNEAIRNYNQSISDYNKMIDQQIRSQKAENTGNFLSSLGQQGVGLLANSAFNKNSTNTSSTSTSATSSTNTPSLSNYLSNQSILHNPDKFWNIEQK